MSPDDAARFISGLKAAGLEFYDGHQAVDIVVVDQLRGPTVKCRWLSCELTKGSPAYCWLSGTLPGELAVPDGRSTKDRNAVDFCDPDQERLTLIRSERDKDVYWDKQDQKEVFVGHAGSARRPEELGMDDLQAIPLRIQVKKSENWQVGERLGGRWPIHKILRGGMGIVFIVYDESSGSLMAVKTFIGDFFDESHDAHLRFKQEASVWISLGRHPNIAYAQRVVNINNKPHIFLEYVSGGDLQQLIGATILKGNLSEVVKYALQFCDGMIFAISRGLKVHRDIKPSNCLITETGDLKITDFGLAKLAGSIFEAPDSTSTEHPQGISDRLMTNTGVGAGTAPYMAPEQFVDAKNVDVRADIFSFGAMLFQMFSGELPFRGAESWEEMAVQRIISPPPLTSSGSRLFDEIVARSLRPDPNERYATFQEVRESLASVYEQTAGKLAPLPTVETDNTQLGMRGQALANLGHYAEAIRYWDRLLEKEPANLSAICSKGQAFAAMKQFENAHICFDEALSIGPDEAETWHSKGVAFHSAGDNDSAVRYYSRAVELDETSDSLWYDFGVALAELDKVNDAAGMWFRTVQLNPHHEMAWVNLGAACMHEKKPEGAMECFQKALELNSIDPKLYFNLGSLYSFFYKDSEKALFLLPEGGRVWL